jgi:hypothetical protein
MPNQLCGRKLENPVFKQTTMTERTTGGCQCGAVRYEFDGPPIEVYVCHCTECRKQSASVHGISVIVPSSAARLTSGNLEKWTRVADSGNTLDCFFCPSCGSRVWHGNPQTDTLSTPFELSTTSPE